MVELVILVIVTMTIVPLSTARLTRIIVADKIAEGLRERAARKHGLDSKIHYVIAVCFWCLSVWTAGLHALVALAAWMIFGPLPWHLGVLLLIPATLATSDVAGRILNSEEI